MLIYKRKKHNITSLIEYLNSLENKSDVSIYYKGAEVIATYYISDSTVSKLEIQTPIKFDEETGEPLSYMSLDLMDFIKYDNILEDNFETKTIVAKEITKVQLALMLLEDKANGIMFSVAENFKKLYVIESEDHLYEVLKELDIEGYEDKEVKFFIKQT